MPEGGIKFGQYVLLRRIARGGMAEVFLAQQHGLEGFDRRVAVKRILPHLADAPDFIKMFLGEARLAAQLTHPNIVHIYDFGKVDGDYFIAMEFVDGVHAGTLFKLGELGNPKPERMPPTLVARIGADAAAALHYAHELRGPNGKPLGLVHRDVSPANLMVSFDGIVKLCDFGIAKAAALSDQLTNPGQVKGKYAYMSPEQTVAAPLDGRSDVFSLAIVLWELLSGKPIVSRNDTVEAMRSIRDGKLEPLEKAAPGTPRPLVEAISWALETRRDKRATAADLAQALEAFIKSSPELATPMQMSNWLKMRVQREGTGEHAAAPPRDTPNTSAGPGTLAVPGTASATPVPEVGGGGGGGLIAASRIKRATGGEDDAETLSMGPPSEIRAAIAARRGPAAGAGGGGAAKRRSGPNIIVDETVGRELQRRPITVDPGLEDSVRDLQDTTEEPGDHGDRDRTVRREREDLDDDERLDDSSEDDIVNTFDRRGSKLRDAIARRASSSMAEMPQVVHAMYDNRGDQRADRGDPTTRDPRSAEARAGSEPTPRPPANARRKLPEPTRPPPVRAVGQRTDVMAVPAMPSGPGDRSTPVGMDATIPGVGTGEPRSGANVRLATPHPTTARAHGLPTATTGMLQGGPRLALAIIALVVLAGASFLIAVWTRHRGSGDEVRDAARPIDAAMAVTPAPPLDATAAVVPLDDGGSDAHVTALLEVSTTPPGATVKVGDQTRAAPTRFALAAGTYTITAELAGYQTETREVELLDNEHQVKEIALTRKEAATPTPVAPPPTAKPVGYLSARTQPYSDVYEGSRLLGQTPLAEVGLPPGVYTLTFRNPSRGAVVKRVTIMAGKTTKLQFDL